MNFHRNLVLILVTLSFNCINLFAQKEKSVFFEKFVDSIYVNVERKITKDGGEFKFKVEDYILPQMQLQESFFTNKNPNSLSPVKNGEVKTYFLNGKIRTEENLKNDLNIGMKKQYYKNGEIHKIYYYDNNENKLIKSIVFDLNNKKSDEIFYEIKPSIDSTILYDFGRISIIRYEIKSKTENTNYKVLNAWDYDGKPTVINGNGTHVRRDSLDRIIEKGNFKNGMKTGVWHGINHNTLIAYSESYVEGELIKGISTNEDGNKVQYEILQRNSEFIGGLPALYRFLGSNIRYPDQATKSNISGKVFVNFIIEKDGTISHIKLLKGVERSLNREALRVISLTSGMWIPGNMRGLPCSTYYTMPVTFKLE